MNITIRMIGVATTIFWIFLIVFAISAAYSAKDIEFRFGEPQTAVTADNQLLLSLPITVVNRGLYNIDHFNVTSSVSDPYGSEITRSSTLVSVIRKGQNVTAYHNFTLSIDDLLQNYQSYVFNDTDLVVNESVGFWLAEVIPVQASGNVTMPWGAPLYGFTVGEPTARAYNSTHSLISVPVRFENHAFFDLAGTLEVHLRNTRHQIGQGQTDIMVTQGSRYDGFVDVYVTNSHANTTRGSIEFYFSCPYFSYGPLVIPFG